MVLRSTSQDELRSDKYSASEQAVLPSEVLGEAILALSDSDVTANLLDLLAQGGQAKVESGPSLISVASDAVLSNDQPSMDIFNEVTPIGLANVTNQWHLNNSTGYDLNVEDVWASYTGKGIVVAVVDDGVQYTHGELKYNYNTALDYNMFTGYGNGVNTSTSNRHGTAVAGVIAARNDASGTTGVAYDAKVTGMVALGGPIYSDKYIALLNKQINVHVANNSWGFSTPFSGNAFYAAGIETAMANLMQNGRGGLGTVSVWSAGNSRTDGDDTNYTELSNSRFGIVVAAGNPDGTIASFSTPGASILITAPGTGIYTTDLMNSYGFSPTNYATVSGTSFSAPAVSGVVALMLQANPGLGYRDVQEILAYSARHVDINNASWEYNGATNWNGGAMHVSEDFGFGYIDAKAAVGLAESWLATRSSAIYSNEVLVSGNSGAVNVTLNDLSTITSTINIASPLDIEHAEVQLNLTHAKVGELIIKLISPDGTESILMNNPALGSSTYSYSSTWSLSSTQHWGESGVGDWTLSITDTAGGNTGFLTDWTLRLYGEAQTTDNMYIYTDEFGNYTSPGDAARQTLTDTAGIDTLNVSAVTSDLAINLAPGSSFSIAGNTLTLESATVIENALGGYGNDLIVGTAINNILYGGHGDDTLWGFAGNDSLNGGHGNDELDGGTGNDTMVGGLGDDDYILDSASDSVTELLNSGLDTINVSSSYTLGANLENLVLLGSSNLTGTGNTLHNRITGNSGNNSLVGAAGNDTLIAGAGADTLAGGTGHDIYEIDSADIILEGYGAGTDTVRAGFSYTLGKYLENLELTGSGHYNGIGNAYNNSITGNVGDNSLEGGAGNDLLIGGAGADTMVGGTGNDIYDVDSASDVLIEVASAGSDTVRTSLSFTLATNFEKLILTGTGNINGTGNSASNSLSGNTGNNRLDGGAGGDYMAGGLGNDVYIVDNIADRAVESSAGGTDVVQSTVNFTLGGNVENLELLGSMAIKGYGNSLANTLTGNSGNNYLGGNSGNDTLIGGAGNDTLNGGGGNDTYHQFSGSFGNDIIQDFSGSADVLDLSNFLLSSATWQAVDSADLGTNVDQLKITLAGGNTILIERYFSNTNMDDDFSSAGVGYLETIRFSDDSFVDLTQVRSLIA